MANSKLEEVGIIERNVLDNKKEYQGNGVNEYNESHADVKSDGDVKGKDNGIDIGFALPDPNGFSISANGVRTQRIDYSKFPTRESGNMTMGGKYDREGNPNVPRSGRLQHAILNRYNEDNEYTENSVTIDTDIPGQFYIR